MRWGAFPLVRAIGERRAIGTGDGAMDGKRPNILFITSDQQRGDCYGFAGRPVRTPHLDLMAAQGTRFDNCITPNLVCQPSRASILTGQLPLTHGVADNGIDLRPEVGETGYAAQMATAGYDSAFIGKAHFATCANFGPTGTPECKISSADYGLDWNGPYMGFEHVELMTLGHWHKTRQPSLPPAGQHFEQWFFETVAGEAGYELWKAETRPGTGAAQTWNSALPVAWHSSTWCADRTLAYLEDHREGDPFSLWVSFPDPHHPFDCPEPWSSLHHPDEVDLPVEGEKDLDRRPWWHRASLENEPDLADPVLRKFRASGSRAPDQTEAQLREMTANYYGMISLIDHNVGRILAGLDSLELAENTIVVYSTDHGDYLGDHGLYLKGPIAYEGVLRVGMIVKGPGVPAGKIVHTPVSTLDLGATFCDYGGTSLPDQAQSESLRSLIEGEETRDVAYSEWNVNASRCGVALSLRTVRTENAKLTLELGSEAGEMYDLKEDPYEMRNVYDDPAYANLRKELKDMIAARPGSVRDCFDDPVGMA
jgi:arylsulfatase A-like enzyme